MMSLRIVTHHELMLLEKFLPLGRCADAIFYSDMGIYILRNSNMFEGPEGRLGLHGSCYNFAEGLQIKENHGITDGGRRRTTVEPPLEVRSFL